MSRNLFDTYGWLVIGLSLAACGAPVGIESPDSDGDAGARSSPPRATDSPPAELLARQLLSSDWSTVRAAKVSLESLQDLAIPHLISLLESDEQVKLTGTGDLIYPGATEFWGHGEFVDYDIDWISVRAGWALEDLTFQAFGFREGAIDHDQLLEASIAGKVDVPFSEVAPRPHDAQAGRERRARAVARAREWWAHASPRWSRLESLVEALESEDSARQVEALNWLRHGETRCDGLTKESFTRRLLPHVRRLAQSEHDSVKEQASYLLHDFDRDEWYWLRSKPQEPRNP
jgi:hypothetical protein